MEDENVKIIVTVPNQKVVRIVHTLCDDNHLYTRCNLKANKTAMKELTPSAYKLYMYLLWNNNDYVFALSPVDVCNETNISNSSYKRAVKELIEFGYLVQSKQKNRYTFFENKDDYSVKMTLRETQNDTTTQSKSDGKQYQKEMFDGVKMNREIKQDKTLNNTYNITDSPTAQTASTMPTEMDGCLNELSDFSYEDKVKLIDYWHDKHTYKEIAFYMNCKQSCVGKIIKEYQDNGNQVPEPHKEEVNDIPTMSGGYLTYNKEELFNMFTANGTATIDEIPWDSLRCEFAKWDVSPQDATQVLNEFKQRLTS